MSELKATPGPWFAEHSSVIGFDDEIVTTCVVGSVYRGDDAEDYATAHLIAAAPDLYEALEEAVKDLAAAQVNARMAAKHDSKWAGVSEAIQPSVDRARAALASARGES